MKTKIEKRQEETDSLQRKKEGDKENLQKTKKDRNKEKDIALEN